MSSDTLDRGVAWRSSQKEVASQMKVAMPAKMLTYGEGQMLLFSAAALKAPGLVEIFLLPEA